ncbi:MAG: hypothetical protein RL026_1606 [Pseudomonadota bacterium]|jgi:N-acetylmuramoyl-L-alanine amidase
MSNAFCRLICALGAALACLLPLEAVAASRLQSVSLAPAGGQAAQLVLSWDRPLQPQVFVLHAPYRLVIDQPDTRAAPRLSLPAAAGPVLALRRGDRPGGSLRLVLELKPGAAWRIEPAEDGAGGTLRVLLGAQAAVAPPAPMAAVPPGPVLPAVADAAPEAVRAAHAPSAAAGRDIIIAVDAGHGGEDPGAIGRHGTREKDVVLAIAHKLARRIDAEPGMRAVLTRDGDRFIPLRDRMARARAAKADLFVSVHADAVTNRSIAGSSVYVLSERGASSEAARWLAERENAADLRGGISLDDKSRSLAQVLVDLSQDASIESSMTAAEQVLVQLDQVGTVRRSRVQQAGFVVLKSPDTPAMLVETAFISNPDEERRLAQPAHQEALARAIFQGLQAHFRRSPPDGSLYALQRQQGTGAPVIAAGVR